MESTLVFVPTYNEKENVERICLRIMEVDGSLDLLFVDDNSSDGTGEVLDDLASRFSRVKVVHRAGKLGIGSAHQVGIRWAYERGYKRLITMDCDFTHDPLHIPELLAKADEGCDVVVGSRYLQRDSLAGWNIFRKALTHAGHLATRVLLGMSYDATNAYRCYRLDRVPAHLFSLVSSPGYSFFFESLFTLHRNGFKICQIPITLPKRTYGHSKMDFGEVQRSLRLLGITYFKSLVNPEKFEVGEALEIDESNLRHRDDQGWEEYWENHKTAAGGLLYDAIASFYRKFIIRRSLNHFVSKHFVPGSQILHAGCGSGQVDADIRHVVSITGLDISVNALRLYKRINGRFCKVLHGSIFEIPLPDASVDGIYNLGVMEHFTEDQIRAILKDFKRVLKSDGRVLVFWPPEFGLSVLFFKALTVFFKKVLRRKHVQFHPDEITRVRSRKHVTDLFEEAGYRVRQYYFGPLDAFTYVVLAAEPATAA